jgi:holo-[acyl-carrier protein] synthase
MKALGTGVRGVSWKDIEVVRHESGAPSVKLHGRAERRAQRLGVREISLSLSHSREYAVAFVVVRLGTESCGTES